MSTRSSSWSGSGAAQRASDIIDLDQFMRGGVRPLRPDAALLEQLVVDGGGRRVGAGAPGRGGGASGSAVDRTMRRARRYAKRFSHDSGLSDDSYVTRVSHRRGRGASGRSRERQAVRAPGSRVSRKSLREFRAVCERALLDQQQQIARVVELCERLTQRKAQPDERQEHHRTPTSADSSDGSSSSRTTPDCARKQQHRTDECKTYKIIMSKLDELNRVFGARARVPAGAARPAASSSGSVSMSDKVVGTEPEPPGRRRPAHRTDGAVLRCETRTAQARGDCSPRVHSTMAEGSGGESSTSACDARCGFDLEDPVHLYSQAKRLQGDNALAASESARGRRRRCARDAEAAKGGPPTLCALCRGYWRTLRQFVVAQLFGAPPGRAAASSSDAF